MRELLQNAEDACQLQLLVDKDTALEIIVRYSPQDNWVEISDNGLGMDRAVFEESFTTIGASKTASPKLQELLARAGAANRPIGQFGIGVLSCFGVADVVEIKSRADGETPIAFRITDRHSDFEELSIVRPGREGRLFGSN
jgi:molecular chaperone HtpG